MSPLLNSILFTALVIPSVAQKNLPQKDFSAENKDGKWTAPTTSHAVELSRFSLPKDSNLEITLWASTPMLYNPTNMDIDHKGRVWVAEGVNFRKNNGRREGGDRIVVLQDTTGDGKADKSHTFVQEPGLEAPLGVTVFDNKVIVPMPPNLIVYTDVDRDLVFDPKVDKREVLLTGFNASQHDHSLHSVVAGPDGKWYFNNGNCGAIFTDQSGKTFNMNGVYRGGGGSATWFTDNHKLNGKKSDDGFLWTSGFGVRIDPDGKNAEIYGHGFRNAYEQSVNSFGEIFQTDNDDTASCRASYVLEYGSAGYFTKDGQRDWKLEQRPGQSLPQAHWRQSDPGTFDAGEIYGLGAPTGNTFYENGALGKEWEGTFLAGESARNTVFGFKPEENGATFKMKHFDFLTSNAAKAFVGADGSKQIDAISDDTSQDILFRPSDISVGPDGAVYVADWYDGRVGGHSTIDSSAFGAIYRIAPKGFQSVIPDIDLATTEGQIEALKSPAVNVRHLGFTRLADQKDKSLDAVSKLLSHPNKYIAARAIWLLPHLGEEGIAACEALLKSEDDRVKMVAFKSLRSAKVNILKNAKFLANDTSPAIRREVALSLRHFTAEQTADIFVELAKHCDTTDKNAVEAIGLGAENKENAIWLAIKESQQKQDPEQWTDSFAKLTWRLWPTAAIEDLTARAKSDKVSPAQRELAVESLAFIEDPKSADALFTIAAEDSPVKKIASYWLLKRGTGSWAKFNLKQRLKQTGIYDPDKIVINAITVPAQPKESNYATVAEILALKGDATRGKAAIMRCVMCHNIEGVGPNYGPELKGWGKTQARESIVTAIRNPSDDIAHGYKGGQVLLKDGKIVQGIISRGDPTTVTSTGGMTQMIPRSQIKKIKNMDTSLMIAAEQLGLTAQDVADIASYMQQWK